MAFFPAEGGQIYYEHHRKGPIAVMLVHGWGTGTRIWDGLAAHLIDAGYSVLSFDQRGCGRSDKDFAEVSIAAGAKDLSGLIEHLGLDRVVLCGWSIGGAIATMAASQLRDRLIGLVSICGATPRFTAAEDFPGAPTGSAAGMVQQLRADRFNFLGWMAENSVVVDVGPASRERMRLTFAENAHTADQALLDLDDLDLRHILRVLPVPFMAMAGRNDIFVDPAIHQAASEMAPAGEIAWFETGHTPFLEDPAGFRDRLLQFLEKLDGGKAKASHSLGSTTA
ncbi:alpha/beta hydrolase [Sphingobium sp.]|uniref:alpha/beta fold hydrolase n=1 Tax=Sphingobium sp. TaxID=1912891 RepID=UPI0028BEEEC5|nr:alpha/beta hydrolase [Sphingobium sp.]